EVDLFLEIFGAGRDQHPLTAENRRNQVRERLARAGPRLREQHAAFLEPPRDGGGHFRLAGARLEVRNRARPRAIGCEDGFDQLRQRRAALETRYWRSSAGLETCYSGYSGNFRHSVSTSIRIVVSARSSSGALSARVMSSPMTSISASRIPRVVTAGVPTRMPLATIGGF